LGARRRRRRRGKGRSEHRKREEEESGERGAWRASWRQSWVFPEADSPAISVTDAAGRPPERRRLRKGQPRESLEEREEARRRRGFSGRGSCWL
jgi:hypothetical protein